MAPVFKQYDQERDYARVSALLTETYVPGMRTGNWLEPRWEYMHYHPNLDEASLDRIGVWEHDGMLVAVAHYEHALGEAFFQVRPGYESLKETLVDYAESSLYEVPDKGLKRLNLIINDFDHRMAQTAERKGYVKTESPLWESCYWIRHPLPEIRLPAGFALMSLEQQCDVQKVHRVMWRGFGHSGEPPAEGIAWRERKMSAPNFRHHLTMVTLAPNGDYASFCGMWYDTTNKFCYVEPVATDPDYRRMGLGAAVVLSSIGRASELGAEVAYVGSGQPFYEALGFKKMFKAHRWNKQWR